ncbi:ketopantoate reductase family protein [Hamadaea tsunoensis]|uniref:ketopantoate reductase family protein n=1 Tax=Hamadaea tsunoensis TaxID=53368 RepID=UPI00068639F7|nr:2-dehydropantoate 2-reductase [Hamadaea tsunoensis]
MRFVIFGAGAVGGVVGGLLAVAGHEVALLARGRHLAAIRSAGLTVETPTDRHLVRVAAAETPAELGMRPDDVVFLAMKGNDTGAALRSLAPVADPRTPVVCLQNGVANERAALRLFEHVYGICVMCPTTHLEPGVVRADCAPTPGILDIGQFPGGVDETAVAIASALADAGFVSEPDPAIMRWKYAKLLTNLGNAIDAVCTRTPEVAELTARARAEARGVLDAAGIGYASDAEDAVRRGEILQVRTERGGGSSWQSLTRGTGSIETDYLNGEIVLLARERGLAAPLNENARRWANRFAAEGRVPRSLSVAEWTATLGSAAPWGLAAGPRGLGDKP